MFPIASRRPALESSVVSFVTIPTGEAITLILQNLVVADPRQDRRVEGCGNPLFRAGDLGALAPEPWANYGNSRTAWCPSPLSRRSFRTSRGARPLVVGQHRR